MDAYTQQKIPMPVKPAGFELLPVPVQQVYVTDVNGIKQVLTGINRH